MTIPGTRSTAARTVFSAACLLATTTLVGCASILAGEPGNGATGAGPYEHPSGAQDVLVSVDLAGWHGPLEYELRNTASFLLLGNGTAIVPGAVDLSYPGPAINPLHAATVTEAQIQALFAAAEAAGLLGAEIDYGDPGVTDQATTYIDITVGGRTYSQAAYALDYEDPSYPNMTDTAREARAALRDFIGTAQALVPADSDQYLPEALLVHRLSPREQTTIDPDLEQQPRAWPITTVPPPIEATYPTSCVAITGPEATSLFAALADANELTPWLIGTEPPVPMAFRAFLPGDAGCRE